MKTLYALAGAALLSTAVGCSTQERPLSYGFDRSIDENTLVHAEQERATYMKDVQERRQSALEKTVTSVEPTEEAEQTIDGARKRLFEYSVGQKFREHSAKELPHLTGVNLHFPGELPQLSELGKNSVRGGIQYNQVAQPAWFANETLVMANPTLIDQSIPCDNSSLVAVVVAYDSNVIGSPNFELARTLDDAYGFFRNHDFEAITVQPSKEDTYREKNKQRAWMGDIAMGFVPSAALANVYWGLGTAGAVGLQLMVHNSDKTSMNVPEMYVVKQDDFFPRGDIEEPGNAFVPRVLDDLAAQANERGMRVTDVVPRFIEIDGQKLPIYMLTNSSDFHAYGAASQSMTGVSKTPGALKLYIGVASESSGSTSTITETIKKPTKAPTPSGGGLGSGGLQGGGF